MAAARTGTTLRVGLTLAEVLVGIVVLAVMVGAWSVALQIAIVMVRRILQLESANDDVAALCALTSAILPLATRDDGSWRQREVRDHRRITCSTRVRRGVTLVELLVSLAIGAAVLVLLTVAVSGVSRGAARAAAAADAVLTRTALTSVLFASVSTAGRGLLDGCGVAVHDGGRRLEVRSADAGVERRVEFFAASDAAGRHALYARVTPFARQPWLEDVTTFAVRGWDVDDHDRLSRLLLAIEHRALHTPLAVAVELPHRPCLEAGP